MNQIDKNVSTSEAGHPTKLFKFIYTLNLIFVGLLLFFALLMTFNHLDRFSESIQIWFYFTTPLLIPFFFLNVWRVFKYEYRRVKFMILSFVLLILCSIGLYVWDILWFISTPSRGHDSQPTLTYELNPRLRGDDKITIIYLSKSEWRESLKDVSSSDSESFLVSFESEGSSFLSPYPCKRLIPSNAAVL